MKSKILIFGKNSLFSKNDLFKSEVRYASIRKNFNEYLNKNIPESVKEDLNNGYTNVIISSGYLLPKNTIEKTLDEIKISYSINLMFPVILSEVLLSKYDDLKIIIIGSESGQKGSYDTEYWLSKAALISYVKERKVSKFQQLNIISPSVIADSPMTMSRKDVLDESLAPKNRFLKSQELIKLSENIFSNDYLCNSNIELNGGKFARQYY